MKVDLVTCVYRQPELWPILAWGYRQNLDYINRVIIVNDELWTKETRGVIESCMAGLPLVLLDHEHDGFGEHKSLKQGAQEVETEYFAYTNGDVVLAPDSLRKMTEDIEEDTLLYGMAHDVSRELKLKDFPDPPILKIDPRSQGAWELEAWFSKWHMCRDCYVMCKTDNYLLLGGHDTENYPSYGFIDYDFGLRWLMHFGADTVEMGRGESYHMSSLAPGQMWDQRNKDSFERKRQEWLEWIRQNM